MSECPHCGMIDTEPVETSAPLGTCPAPCCALKFNNALVDRITARAKKSDFGLGEAESRLSMDDISPKDAKALALVLVGRYHSKYDLVSIFEATITEILEHNNMLSVSGERGERND